MTHNRRELLSRCLDHLSEQQCAPDAILVVNNDSSDGTAEMLDARGVAYVTQENLGSAGGWHRAIEHALAGGYDAVWLMDDDGFPDRSALAALKSVFRQDMSCASSVVVKEDQPEEFVFPFPRLNRAGLPVVWGFPRKFRSFRSLAACCPGHTYPFAHFFNGALISTVAIRKIGNVETRYFIFGDEVDYFFRLRRVGSVVSALDARHYHPDVSQRPYTPTKIYYYIKNTLILNRSYFDLVWLRDAATLLAVIVRTGQRNGIGAALSLLAGSTAHAFYPAIARGLRGKVGKDFRG